MATLRELKGRIGSVASSEKITGAMKMISSAKMHRAEGDLKRLLPFRNQIQTIIDNLMSSDATFSSPLATARGVERVAVVVLGSDDGLCGAYNINIYKQLLELLGEMRAKYGAGVGIDVYPVGKKMAKAVNSPKRSGYSVCLPDGVDSKSEDDAVKAFLETLRERFVNREVDRVEVLYMSFKSAGRQRPETVTLFPVGAEQLASAESGAADMRPYIFEPDANTIFNTVLPMYVLAVMQEVFGENRASEQAARVMAMQSANDNAKKLLDELRLEYNKLRQQSITNELLDIVGGQVRD